MKNLKILFYTALPLILFISGCAEEKTIAMKPEIMVAERTASPFSGAVWIDTEYRWDGNTYIVVPAHWAKPQGVWVQGSWKRNPKGYSWVPGHWKK